jgi:hypothetical protein
MARLRHKHGCVGVRFEGQTGKHVLTMSFSQFDPKLTLSTSGRFVLPLQLTQGNCTDRLPFLPHFENH